MDLAEVAKAACQHLATEPLVPRISHNNNSKITTSARSSRGRSKLISLTRRSVSSNKSQAQDLAPLAREFLIKLLPSRRQAEEVHLGGEEERISSLADRARQTLDQVAANSNSNSAAVNSLLGCNLAVRQVRATSRMRSRLACSSEED